MKDLINPQKVSPTARVLFQAGGDTINATLLWKGWRLLSACSADPIEVELDFSPGGVLLSVANARNLIVGPGRLVPGASYRMRLIARGATATTTAEMRFGINTVPVNGTVQTVPLAGMAMNTSFKIS